MVTYSGRREGLQAQGTRGMVQRGAVLVLILRTKKSIKSGVPDGVTVLFAVGGQAVVAVGMSAHRCAQSLGINK